MMHVSRKRRHHAQHLDVGEVPGGGLLEDRAQRLPGGAMCQEGRSRRARRSYRRCCSLAAGIRLPPGGPWKMSRTLACSDATSILAVTIPASAEVMTKSPSPGQASPQRARPMQPTSPPPTMQAVPNVQLNCAYYQRNANGSWTQRSPVTVDGQTLAGLGVRINPGTIVGGIDLGAASTGSASRPRIFPQQSQDSATRVSNRLLKKKADAGERI
jgi:hypothetical protein